MAKDPAVSFYPSDFIASTALWDNDEVGVYIRLLCYQHINGGIKPSDYEKLCYGYERVREKFKQHEDGLYYNDRMLKESIKRKAYSESRRKNISARYQKQDTENESTQVPTYEDTYEEDMYLHMGIGIGKNISNNISNSNKENTIIPIKVSNSNKYLERFDAFWKVYPKKVGKEDAKKSFLRIKPSEQLLAAMVAKVKELCESEQWRKDRGKYIPNPSTWLNQGRWDDEVEVNLYPEYKDAPPEPIPF